MRAVSHTRLAALGCLVLPLLVAGFLCNSGGGDTDQDDLRRLESEIMELIGDAEASDPQYCHLIAFGSKPCGGPWQYLIYSSEATDSTLLRSKVDRYNRLQAEVNRELGLVSDCALAFRPTIEYADGRCVAAE